LTSESVNFSSLETCYFKEKNNKHFVGRAVIEGMKGFLNDNPNEIEITKS
jgi:hypothetical protein